MWLDSLATKVLLALSSVLGVDAVPKNVPLDWRVHGQGWHANEYGYMQIEVSSRQIIEDCRQSPTQFLYFPNVIHGAHDILINGKKILSYGDHSFKSVETFYGAPWLSCSAINGFTESSEDSELTWILSNYSTYFARFNNFPHIQQSKPITDITNETMNIIAFGSLLFMSAIGFILFGASGYRVGKGSDFISSPPR